MGSVAVVGLLLVTAGCGARVEVLGLRFGGECPVVPTPASTLVVEQAESNVVMFVSNQSFDDPDVRMSVALDGEVMRIAAPLHFAVSRVPIALLAPPLRDRGVAA